MTAAYPGMNLRRWLAVAGVAMAYCIIILGGWIRTTNSGLSCPDWPTCYGQWVLTPSEFAALGDVGYTYFQMMLEWSHRFIAGMMLGPLIMFLTFLAWRSRKQDPTGFKLAIGILVVLFLQAKLGGVTVLDANSPWSVAVHLTNAMILSGLMILYAVRLSQKPPIEAPALFTYLALGTVLLVMGTMATAAVTSKMGAALACHTWPLCDGESLYPSTEGDPGLAVHLMHRTLAAATGIAVLLLFLMSWKIGIKRLRVISLIALIMVVAQICLGAGVIVWQVPVPVAVAHQALGVLLFLKVATLLCLARQGFRRTASDEKDFAHASL